MSSLIMFYGTECSHCHEMFPLVEKLEQELKIKIEKKEIWHNSKNRAEFDRSNNIIKCTGVPFFYNKKTMSGICGSTSYDNLKKLVQEK